MSEPNVSWSTLALKQSLCKAPCRVCKLHPGSVTPQRPGRHRSYFATVLQLLLSVVQLCFEIVPAICPEELREQDPGGGFGVSLSTTPGLSITGGLGVEQIEEILTSEYVYKAPPSRTATKAPHVRSSGRSVETSWRSDKRREG